MLREIQRQEKLAGDIDIVIISGKYGFLRPDNPIELYDQRMTPELATGHRPQVVEKLSRMLGRHTYQDCFIMLEPDYLAALHDIKIPHVHSELTIDQQSLERLRQWVLQENR